MKKIVLIILFSLYFVILSFGILSSVFKNKPMPLYGYYQEKPKPDFNKEEYLNGELQKKTEDYLQEKIKLRPVLVRLYNQINYSLYKKISVKGVVMGKEGYLYEKAYIDSYLGNDFIGQEEIKKYVNELNDLNIELKKRGKRFLIVLAPSKASYFSEYLPKKYLKQEKKISNYLAFKEEINKTNIPQIDFSEYFRKIKPNHPYPLMNKNGIHWTRHAEHIVMDSLLVYFEKEFSYPMPKVEYKDSYTLDYAQFTDNDIEIAMNLLRKKPDFSLRYHNIEFTEKPENSPRVLVIGDSFYWGMIYMGLGQNAFSQSEFWYYNNEAYDGKEVKKLDKTLNKESLSKEIDNYDLIILWQNEQNLIRISL